ncbi:unnamed protein product [Rotaria sp. Silwood2]|nr:unnamed protein product [Rotaria sp. Silwood2]CAF2699527.1 unnamed protein product [Rotaria sp. Silwood2]CAF3991841.1 unnamed protein product [Rotaria sp. Silwood2]CAF4066018.1 unnamed protein product [Rotaria sp. Silwood2]CAF4106856.1 unnamed protein product [Rotaria sp. Silwood2]
MFQQMSSSHSQFHTSSSSSSANNEDELMARRKLEQKRRFQQKQGNIHTDVDTLMQSMFSDLKLQSKTTVQNTEESKKSVLQMSGINFFSFYLIIIMIFSIQELTNTTVDHHFQPQQTHTSAPGAADWSKIAYDDELTRIFHQEEKISNIPAINSDIPSALHHSNEQALSFTEFVYPSWCSQPIVSLPLVYQQVFEASCISNIIQTSVLYPILLLSGLRQDQLSQVWSQVNLHQPGTLIKEELFMALALIALAQNSNGHIFSKERLYHLTEIPIPYFQIQQEQASPTPPPPPPPPPPVYQQEDFADFTAFEQIEQSTDGSHATVPIDFNENNLYPPDIKATSPETQSIASLDLPMPTIHTNYHDDTSQKGISDNISFTSSNNNDIIVPAADTQSLHSINSSEPSKLELTQFSFFSDDTSQIDSHVAVWIRCFEKCYSILSQANEIFSSIESPTLCMEILQQTRTRDYVHNLQEIFHVHKRIYTAAVLEPTTTSQLITLWKQIVVLWTNLQSFFSTGHLHLLNDDDVDYSPLLFGDTYSYCSICLLSTVGLDTVLPNSSSFNTAYLTFAGRLYHAPCANFYLNLIDGILPSLRRSS